MSYITLPNPPSFLCLQVAGCALPDLGLSDFVIDVHYSNLVDIIKTSHSPKTVIAWLMCPRYDALELAGTLSSFGFSGRLVAISHVKLPRKQMVLQELRSCSPQISFEIWERPEHAQLIS